MTQDQALKILKTGVNVFLTGEPGSGKTHTVNQYIQYLRSHGIEPSITASTGIAATHVGGMTIHSWAGIGISKTLSENELDRLADREPLQRRLLRAKVLIIDEISMLDADVLDLVERVCERVRDNMSPFGGLQVIFVGDFFQLPPIAPFGEERPRFAYLSEAWSKAEPVVCDLEEQYRQTDDTLYKILGDIRRGIVNEETRERLGERFGFRPEAGERVPELYTHNIDVDRLNTLKLQELEGESKRFLMQSSGKANLIEQLKRGCLSPEILELKENALVMFTKNSQDGSFVNGTLGVVESFWEEPNNPFSSVRNIQPVIRTREGRRIMVSPADWTIEEPGMAAAKIIQLPLRLAWAMTVHKSQGMSMDAAVVDLSRAFEYGQGYVALSRVRTLEGLYLLGVNDQALRVHPEILEQDNTFRLNSAAAAVALADLSEEALAKKHALHLRSLGGKTIEEVSASPKHDLMTLREKHTNAYRPWSEREEGELVEAFDSGLKIKAIAEKLGRQTGGIRARLRKLGKIE